MTGPDEYAWIDDMHGGLRLIVYLVVAAAFTCGVGMGLLILGVMG
jgi:hypothetical protein